MEIKTKYNIGDKVFVLHNDRICVFYVEYINTESDKNSTNIRYTVRSVKGSFLADYKEAYLFPTKEELLKSL